MIVSVPNTDKNRTGELKQYKIANMNMAGTRIGVQYIRLIWAAHDLTL